MRLDRVEEHALPRDGHLSETGWLASGRRVIENEAGALSMLAESLGKDFIATIALLQQIRGRIVVTGMGKSGHIARKIAATLASTGAPAMFVHPAEASHGDLGMITNDDAILALSNSGETAELRDLLLYAKRFDIPLVAIVGRARSTLAEAARVTLLLPAVSEACPLGLAPTTSTTAMLALGDALAVALLEARGFTARDFAVFHPGGKLGSQLVRVEELMHKGPDLPLVTPELPMREALLVMTAKRLGCVGVVGPEGDLLGIVTDGDVRRQMSPDLLERTAASLMTARPLTIQARALAVEAMAKMNEGQKPITVLFVTDTANKPVGALHLHDCLRAGIA